ncbi:M50 family metallopeptidase [Alkalihalobacillus sp. LMS39]|uniref:M50 family metallopeptidase n=1 Tax=Alkalihalobacillus sp. LMS39 TaxID=2924032 RepID=UPI001FB29E43|nr:M50 family metallopeptidase [Alkalihalobacillus sp. LMS39]UOE96516.1 M50 family metallopeptidase [Alkalihalobacillus sp. LMS39]
MIGLVKKIKISPFFWFVLGIGIITGYFREVLMVFFIVLIHELGHAVTAHYFKWKIQKIELLPFGGVAEMNESSNRPFKEEFFVIIAGPLQHVWLIAVSFFLVQFDFWTAGDHEMFIMHNAMIACFNLLPIWPLDGGRLLNLAISYYFPFEQAQKIAIYSSVFILCVVAIVSYINVPFHLNLWVVLSFLCISNYLEWKQRHFVFMRFLLDRLNGKITGARQQHLSVPYSVSVRDVVKMFRRGHDHYIVIKGANDERKVIKESAVLQAYFHENKLHHSLKDIIKIG